MPDVLWTLSYLGLSGIVLFVVNFALVSRIADVILLTIGSCLILHYGLTHVVRGQAGERVSTDAGQTHREVPVE
jgi:hypothetical protein